jgi:hypothetical protein
VQTVFNGPVLKDISYMAEFSATGLAPGLYIYKMTTDTDVYTGKMLLIRDR